MQHINLFKFTQGPNLSLNWVCPCGGFLGWKQIRLGGKSLSRSYGDLRNLGSMQSKGWAWESHDHDHVKKLDVPKASEVQAVVEPVQEEQQPGTSPLEKLPPEVLGKSLSFAPGAPWK